MQSYKHFTLVFGIFMLCAILGKSKKEDINIRQRNLPQSIDQEYLTYL